MALHIKEFSGISGGIQIAMQPEIDGTEAGLTDGGTYTVAGNSGGASIVELYAAGAAHTYTVSGGPGTVQHIASGERLSYGFNAGLVITVES